MKKKINKKLVSDLKAIVNKKKVKKDSKEFLKELVKHIKLREQEAKLPLQPKRCSCGKLIEKYNTSLSYCFKHTDPHISYETDLRPNGKCLKCQKKIEFNCLCALYCLDCIHAEQREKCSKWN